MKSRLVWASDVHLNFCKLNQRRNFYQTINMRAPTHVVFTGDIGEAQNVRELMYETQKFVNAPVYFVLGNHDFYHSGIKELRSEIKQWQEAVDDVPLLYLPTLTPVSLTNNTCLIGVDGFYDGQYGNYWQSKLIMSDFALIKDIAGLSKEERFWKLSKIAKDEATQAASLLTQAANKYDTIYFATHVPPFLEATWHKGQHSDDTWAPYFSCKAIGDCLRRFCEKHIDKRVVVLCGHTHGSGTFQALPNLLVETASAQYGRPMMHKVIEL